MNIKWFLLNTAIAILMLGCLTNCAKKMTDQKIRTEVQIMNPSQISTVGITYNQQANGSLWSTQSMASALLYDQKARRINDIVTVKILENTSATNNATTSGKKTSERSAGITSLFGLEKEAENVVTHNFNPASLLKTSTENSFQGSGSTTRSGKIVATVTSIVKQVYPNGNMYIEGKREIIVNSEKQIIYISGIIRQKDISVDNTILSTAIAEMQVQFSGNGIVSQNQKEGWLGRLMGIIWPF